MLIKTDWSWRFILPKAQRTLSSLKVNSNDYVFGMRIWKEAET